MGLPCKIFHTFAQQRISCDCTMVLAFMHYYVVQMPSYKLTYFNVRARAAVTRYMFKLKGVEFEDVRLEGFEGAWTEFKPSEL